MQYTFLKMHGAGNRILIVDERVDNRPPPDADQLRSLGNVDTGPGFDQLMWVRSATEDSFAARYQVFNADGSEVEQCGNGVRCVAWMLAQQNDGSGEFRLQSPAGPITARMIAPDRISVDMGPPEFLPERVPFVADQPAKSHELEVLGEMLTISVVSMGNPHCVVLVDAVADARVAELGPAIEHHQRFPAFANVGFAALRSRSEIDLRVHERGVGETRACGTGACAAMVVLRQLGHVDDEVEVNLAGGQLVVSWRGDASPVWLTGNAELISEGTIDL